MNGLLNRILAFDSNSQPILVDTKRSLNPLEISRAIARCRHVIHHDLSGQRLAIIGTSSVDFFVWLLAAWAEGRSVIPVDESLPAERRDLLLRYADAGMVTDIPMEGETRNAPSHDWDNADEAMVLFTSGSTGQPQGWLTSAGALLADDTVQQVSFMNVLHWSSISHSQSSYHVVALSHGKRVVCVANDEWMDNQKMLAIIQQWNAELVFCTPSYASIIAQNDQPWLKQLKTYLYGEVARPDLVKNLNATNLYGQTEGPSAWMAIQTSQGDWVPEPTYDLSIRELDSDLEVNKAGLVGRLVANNASNLATKQIDSPSLLSLPFDTGDLAAWTSLTPPRFKLLGRSDRTHKIRGFRVDLTEIEARLISNGCDTAAVIFKGDKLIAYVTPENQDIHHLRIKLANSLPPYMIPSLIHSISVLPMTSHGKVDTASLHDIEAENDYVAPTTPAEQSMCDLWQEILGVERVGLHDDWVSIGGHSLAALSLSQKTGYSIREILINPTVQQLLATKSSEASLEENPTGRVPWLSSLYVNGRAGRTRKIPSFVVSIILRIARLGINLFKGMVLTTEPFDLEEREATEANLRAVVSALLRTHPILTASLTQGEKTLKLGVYGVDDVIVSAKERPRRIIYDLIKNIYSGPLFKIQLSKGPTGKIRVAFWLHHHIGDHQSTVILKRDLLRIAAGESVSSTPTGIYDLLKNHYSATLDSEDSPLIPIRRRSFDPMVLRTQHPTRERRRRSQAEIIANAIRKLTGEKQGGFYLTADLRFLSNHPETANTVGNLATGLVRATLSPSGINYRLKNVIPQQADSTRPLVVNVRSHETDPPRVRWKSTSISFLPGHLEIDLGPNQYNVTWSR